MTVIICLQIFNINILGPDGSSLCAMCRYVLCKTMLFIAKAHKYTAQGLGPSGAKTSTSDVWPTRNYIHSKQWRISNSSQPYVNILLAIISILFYL